MNTKTQALCPKPHAATPQAEVLRLRLRRDINHARKIKAYKKLSTAMIQVGRTATELELLCGERGLAEFAHQYTKDAGKGLTDSETGILLGLCMAAFKNNHPADHKALVARSASQ